MNNEADKTISHSQLRVHTYQTVLYHSSFMI